MPKKTEKLTKKSENENKKSVFSIFEKHINNTPVTKSNGKQYVSFGRKNDAPNQILDMYSNSPTLASCIQFCVSALIGNGIKLDEGNQIMPNYREDWNSFIRKIATDYLLYGSFAFQIIKNKDNATYSVYHQPLDTVRCSERDADGVIQSWWISADWTAPNKQENTPIELPSFIMRPDNEYNLKMGQAYLYVYESYSPTMRYYWTPVWWSSVKAVQAEIEYLQNDLAQGTNNFLASGMISLPPAADDEEKQAIVQEIRDTFVGSSNSARLMVCFRNDSDDTPIHFEKFSHDAGEMDIYANANERAISRILEGFSIPSRMLIGLPPVGKGLSSEGKLLEVAFNVYNTLAGKYYRGIILGTVNNLFAMNGIDVQLEVEDIKFDIDSDTTTTEQAVQQDITEENIEEAEI